MYIFVWEIREVIFARFFFLLSTSFPRFTSRGQARFELIQQVGTSLASIFSSHEASNIESTVISEIIRESRISVLFEWNTEEVRVETSREIRLRMKSAIADGLCFHSITWNMYFERDHSCKTDRFFLRSIQYKRLRTIVQPRTKYRKWRLYVNVNVPILITRKIIYYNNRLRFLLARFYCKKTSSTRKFCF